MRELIGSKLFRIWLVSYILIFLIPVSLCAVLLHRTVQMSVQKLEETGSVLLDKYSSRMDLLLREADNTALKLGFNPYIAQCAASEDYTDSTGIMAAYKLQQELVSTDSSYDQINTTYVFFPRSASVLYRYGRADMSDLSAKGITDLSSEQFAALLEQGNGCYTFFLPSGERVLFSKRQLQISTQSGRTLIYVLIQLDNKELAADNRSLERVGAKAFITDSAGVVYPEDMPSDLTGYITLSQKSTQFDISYHFLCDESEFYSDVTFLQNLIGVILVIMIGAGFIISYFLAKRNYRPVSEMLNTYFQDVAEYAGKDELTAIGNFLTELRKQKTAYEQDYYRTGRLMRDMSLTKMLTSTPEQIGDVLEEGRRAGFLVADGQKFCAVVSVERIGDSSYEHTDQETRSLIDFSVMNVCEEMGGSLEGFVTLVPLSIQGRTIISGIVAPEFSPEDTVRDYVGQVRIFFEEQLDVTLSVCVSGFSENEQDNPKLYDMALKTNDFKMANGIEDTILFYHETLQEKQETSPNEGEAYSSLVSNIIEFINENYADESMNASSLADRFGVTLPYISTVFKRQTGTGLLQFIHSRRISEATALLGSTNMSIKDISIKVGYNNAVTMARTFRKVHGMSPQAYKERHLTTEK